MAASTPSPEEISPTALEIAAASVGFPARVSRVAWSTAEAVCSSSAYCWLSVAALATSATGTPEMSLTAWAWTAGSVGFAARAFCVAGSTLASVASSVLYCSASAADS